MKISGENNASKDIYIEREGEDVNTSRAIKPTTTRKTKKKVNNNSDNKKNNKNNAKNNIINIIDNNGNSIVANDNINHINNKISISVIVPVYNVEKYLKRCLDSLINQTLKNIEIICINDGSKDNCLNILKEYKEKDNRIKIIDQENQGVSVARNNGLNIAQGEYIAFVDSDDYIDLDYLEVMYGGVGEEKGDIIQAKYFLIKNLKSITNKKIELNLHTKFNFFWTNLYRNDFIKSNNIEFKPNIKMSEDVTFFLECFLKSSKIIEVDNNKTYYHYILRLGSATTDMKNNAESKFDDFLEMIKTRMDLLNKYRDTEILEIYILYYMFYSMINWIKRFNINNQYSFIKSYEIIKYLQKSIIDINPLLENDKAYEKIFKINNIDDFKEEFMLQKYNFYLLGIINLTTKYKNSYFTIIKLFDLVEIFKIKSKNNKKYFRLFGLPIFKIVKQEKIG